MSLNNNLSKNYCVVAVPEVAGAVVAVPEVAGAWVAGAAVDEPLVAGMVASSANTVVVAMIAPIKAIAKNLIFITKIPLKNVKKMC